MNRFFTLACLLLGFAASAQQDVPSNLFGNWMNLDGEVLTINVDNTFTRSNKKEVKATGVLAVVDGQLRVTRSDSSDSYDLLFYTSNLNLVVTKPNSHQAWLFQRIGD